MRKKLLNNHMKIPFALKPHCFSGKPKQLNNKQKQFSSKQGILKKLNEDLKTKNMEI